MLVSFPLAYKKLGESSVRRIEAFCSDCVRRGCAWFGSANRKKFEDNVQFVWNFSGKV